MRHVGLLLYFILYGLSWGTRSSLRLQGRGFRNGWMEAPTFQMLHAGRAGEGSFLHHLSREDRPINLHPYSASVWGLYRGEGVFLRAVFCLYDTA